MEKSLFSNMLEKMKMNVTREENRCISFTNKQSAYFFTQSHETNHVEYAWFEGINVATKRIFGGYQLFIDNELADQRESEVSVYPHKFVRKYRNELIEEFWMIDYRNVLEITLSPLNKKYGIFLKGQGVKFIKLENNIAYFKSIEGEEVIAVSSTGNQTIAFENNRVYFNSSKEQGGFLIAVGPMDSVTKTLIDTRNNLIQLKIERIKRMEEFLSQNVFMETNDETFNLAFKWLNINMNSLITSQQGEGIYAGLPWFNEYWGRDQFISLPGATFVTGLFETARKILIAFTKFQNTDPNSKFYGRLPNILGTSRVNYHTTDATPRFNIQLLEYIQYTGDTSIIKELYPSIKMSIEGSIKHWVDESGYLLHDDNETWMDARDALLNSYSPRDSRANDIQALWYHQLLSGVYFATFMGDRESASQWQSIANQLKSHFEHDFVNIQYDYLADRLKPNGEADFTIRPNQLFALEMLEDQELKQKIIRKAWLELVYPWGVASLEKHHPFFHPFHLTKLYHKDEAYHNGTIWTWLNGIAMQRMIEAGQPEMAYQLFKNMNNQALNWGVVGGLGENLDAYPEEGKDWPKLTGAYLQAWSNAEHLRVWYQYFLGIQPNLIENRLIIAPRIPNEMTHLKYTVRVGEGFVSANYSRNKDKTYCFTFNQLTINVVIDIIPYEQVEIEIKPNTILLITEQNHQLLISLCDEQELGNTFSISISHERLKQHELSNKLFQDLTFSSPMNLNHHPIIVNK